MSRRVPVDSFLLMTSFDFIKKCVWYGTDKDICCDDDDDDDDDDDHDNDDDDDDNNNNK